MKYLFHSEHATATQPAGARSVEGSSICKEKKTGCTEAVAEDNALMAAQNRVKGRANINCVVRVQDICVVALRCQEPKIEKGVSELTEGCCSS